MRLAAKLALSLGTTLLLLLVFEVGCRVQSHLQNQHVLSNALANRPEIAAGAPATFGDIIRLSLDDRIAYELRPDLRQVVFKGAQLTTNSRGFRAPEMPEAEPEGGVTIVGLGDSIMFGHGVGDGESFIDGLGELLAKHHPERAWRCINAAVPGYNTVMEVATLEQKLLVFDPDLVILGLCGNDFGPPNYVRIEEDVWDLSRSFLAEAVRARLDPDPRAELDRQSGLSFRRRWAEEQEGVAAPERYADLFGERPAMQALARLDELSEREGFEVLALLMYETAAPEHDASSPDLKLLATCERLGFHTLNMQPQITPFVVKAKGEFTWDLFVRTRLAANPSNGHPSAMLHTMTARTILAYLEESGALDTLLAGE
jgi:lysophospholipase L1-like esterase